MPKPDTILCMYIDYHTVNSKTIKDHYPLPDIDDLLNSMHSSYWFTKFDLAAGSHQIRIATAVSQQTALMTKLCLYEWQVLPFGLANTPSQLMCMMNSIIEPMKHIFIIANEDNMMIHSRTVAEHIVHV